jgi:2-C-methyl-D-erythritol 4-phosphate cytidylyltransferase
MMERIFYAIVAAAGYGLRFGKGRGKQFLELGGIPILVHSLVALEGCGGVERVIVTVNLEDREWVERDLLPSFKLEKLYAVVAGGQERQHSVYNALEMIPNRVYGVVIHDGARPLASRELFCCVMEALEGCEGVVPAVPCRDTVKEIRGEWVARTPDRALLRQVQTPQAFRLESLRDAHQKARKEGFLATDDAALLERYGYSVRVVEGERSNIKITYPEDLALARILLEHRGKGGVDCELV